MAGLLYTVAITRETNGNLGFQTKNQRFDGGDYFDVNKWYTTVLTIDGYASTTRFYKWYISNKCNRNDPI